MEVQRSEKRILFQKQRGIERRERGRRKDKGERISLRDGNTHHWNLLWWLWALVFAQTTNLKIQYVQTELLWSGRVSISFSLKKKKSVKGSNFDISSAFDVPPSLAWFRRIGLAVDGYCYVHSLCHLRCICCIRNLLHHRPCLAGVDSFPLLACTVLAVLSCRTCGRREFEPQGHRSPFGFRFWWK